MSQGIRIDARDLETGDTDPPATPAAMLAQARQLLDQPPQAGEHMEAVTMRLVEAQWWIARAALPAEPEPPQDGPTPLHGLRTPQQLRDATRGGTPTWQAQCWQNYADGLWDELVRAHAALAVAEHARDTARLNPAEAATKKTRTARTT